MKSRRVPSQRIDLRLGDVGMRFEQMLGFGACALQQLPRKEEVSGREMRVKVSGKLKTYIADKLTSERDKDYLVEFTVTSSGRLYVSKIEEIVKADSAARTAGQS